MSQIKKLRIDFIVNTRGVATNLNKVRNSIKKLSRDIGLQMRTFASRNLLAGVSDGYREIGKSVMRNQRAQKAYWGNYMSGVRGATKGTLRLSEILGRNEGRFQGWALSVMFFGMAIQRVFFGIFKFGTKTFQEVSHSVEGSVTQLDMLQGSMKFLGVVIGSALEPLVESLIPIVESWSDWVQENTELTAGLVKWGAIIGSILFVVGLLALGFVGVFAAVANLGSLVAFVFGETVFGAAAFTIGLLVIALASALIWIGLFVARIGGAGEFFKAIARSIITILFLVGATISGAAAEVVNGLKFLFNVLLGFIESSVNDAISAINLIIKAINLIPGIDIPMVADIDLSGLKMPVEKFGTLFANKGYEALFAASDFLDKYIPLKKGTADTIGALPGYDEEGDSDEKKNTVNVYIDKFENGAPDFEEFLKGLAVETSGIVPDNGGD